ncbi:hypothetical protein [Spirochaeta dissipatitropha]
MIWFAGLIGLIITAVLISAFSREYFSRHGKGQGRSQFHSRHRNQRKSDRNAGPLKGGPDSNRSGRSCPICKASLSGGGRVYSAVFPGKTDRMMHIFGCPYCYPKLEPIPEPRERNCPVCRKKLELEDYAIARMFPPRPGKPKPHVHVLGCTRCRGPRKS